MTPPGSAVAGSAVRVACADEGFACMEGVFGAALAFAATLFLAVFALDSGSACSTTPPPASTACLTRSISGRSSGNRSRLFRSKENVVGMAVSIRVVLLYSQAGGFARNNGTTVDSVNWRDDDPSDRLSSVF